MQDSWSEMMNKLITAGMLSSLLLATGLAHAANESENGAQAVAPEVITIGVMAEMSGIYKDFEGPGTVVAAQMAIDDFGGKVLDVPIKLISADYQNKPEVALSIARRWIDLDKVDMMTSLSNSAVGIGVQKLASDKDTITINVGSGTTKLAEIDCTKYGIQYAYNTYAIASGLASGVMKTGGDTWFFITADYAYGKSMEQDARNIIEKSGGHVVGSVKVPLGTTDFSSYLLQAQASGAKVVALANGGQDFVNSLKQAKEFQIDKGQQLVGTVVFITDAKSLGKEIASGLTFTSPWYWNITDEAEQWSRRFYDKHGAMPTFIQGGVYSAVSSYLKAVEQAGTNEPEAVRKVLGEMEINDMYMKGGKIMPNGLNFHEMYLVRVKDNPSEEWDLFETVTAVPAGEAFKAYQDSECPLVAG
ncbi:ABC transporter substrate-binding protein [Castellaniella sp.]